MRSSRWLPYLLVAACSVLYFLPFLRLLFHRGDEGTLINGAVRVVEGQLPIRDFFESDGTRERFALLAAFFKLLGTTWLATRISLLLTTLGISLLLFYLARRLRCGMELVPLILLTAVSYQGWNEISLHTGQQPVWPALLRRISRLWMDRPRPAILFLAGAAAGLTTWFMLPKGILLCLSFVLLLGILYRAEFRLRSLCMLLGGYFPGDRLRAGIVLARRGAAGYDLR